jgi:uncharacterized protein YndB with AHSA1/START domain
MPEFHGSATTRVTARPDEVFDLITDIDRLPEWNACIESVVEEPPSLVAGTEWVVKMHVSGMPRWDSRSELVELDREARRFAYRSQSDDGNPSFIIWTWEVSASDSGSDVTVRWDGHPQTFWRRVLFSRIRHHQLDKEVPSSLVALATTVQPLPQV